MTIESQVPGKRKSSGPKLAGKSSAIPGIRVKVRMDRLVFGVVKIGSAKSVLREMIRLMEIVLFSKSMSPRLRARHSVIRKP